MMNLPQNIHKTDGAIARSFSQELGLNLDLKTGRSAFWHTTQFKGSLGFSISDDRKVMVTLDKDGVAVWDFKAQCVIKYFTRFPSNFVPSELKQQFSDIEIITNNLVLIRQFNRFYALNLKTGLCSQFAEAPFTDYTYSKKHKLLIYADKDEETINIATIKNDEISVETRLSKNVDKLDRICFSEDEDLFYLFFNLEGNRSSKEIEIYKTDNQHMLDHRLITSVNRSAFWDPMHALIELDNQSLLYEHNKKIYKYNFETEEHIEHITLQNTMYFLCDLESIIDSPSVKEGDKWITTLFSYNCRNGKLLNQLKLSNYEVIRLDLCVDLLIVLAEDFNGNQFILQFNRALQLLEKIEVPPNNCPVKQYNPVRRTFIGWPTIFSFADFEIVNFNENSVSNHRVNFKNSNFAVTTVQFQNRILFYDLINKELHFFDLPTEPEDNYFSEVIYHAHSGFWLIVREKDLIIYNAELHRAIKHFIFPEDWPTYRIEISSDLTYIYGVGENCIKVLNIETGEIEYERIMDVKKKNFNRLFLSEDNQRLYLIEFTTLQSGSDEKYFRLTTFSRELKILRREILDIHSLPAKTSTCGIVPSDDLKKILLFPEEAACYIVHVDDYSVDKIISYSGYLNSPARPNDFHYLGIKTARTNDFHYLGIKTTDAIVLYNTIEKTQIEILKFNSNFRYHESECFFDETCNLFFVADNYYTEIFRVSPFEKLGRLYFDSSGSYFIQNEPDQTSPNGWFYTNAPDKIRVLKTKADGSEPELLPLDDEERQAFIKHHNRKDIVMNRFFEPAKYEEFTRLNAGAQESASQDMAIELSKVEAKRLKGSD